DRLIEEWFPTRRTFEIEELESLGLEIDRNGDQRHALTGHRALQPLNLGKGHAERFRSFAFGAGADTDSGKYPEPVSHDLFSVMDSSDSISPENSRQGQGIGSKRFALLIFVDNPTSSLCNDTRTLNPKPSIRWKTSAGSEWHRAASRS